MPLSAVGQDMVDIVKSQSGDQCFIQMGVSCEMDSERIRIRDICRPLRSWEIYVLPFVNLNAQLTRGDLNPQDGARLQLGPCSI
jgi:hypothetical protein